MSDGINYSGRGYSTLVKEDTGIIYDLSTIDLSFYFNGSDYNTSTGEWPGKNSAGDSGTKTLTHYVLGSIPGFELSPSGMKSPRINAAPGAAQGFNAGTLAEMFSSTEGTLVYAINYYGADNSSLTYNTESAFVKDTGNYFSTVFYDSISGGRNRTYIDGSSVSYVEPNLSTEGWHIYTVLWSSTLNVVYVDVDDLAFGLMSVSSPINLTNDLYFGFNPNSGDRLNCAIGGIRASKLYYDTGTFELDTLKAELKQLVGL